MKKQEFLKLAAEGYGTIPVSCTQPSALSPEAAAEILGLTKRPFAFLLESGHSSPAARYSFLGLAMDSYYKIQGGKLEIYRNGKLEIKTDRPLANLREEAQRRKAPPTQLPLSCGFVGYLGYDLALPGPDASELPAGYLMSPKELLVFDHLKHTVGAVVNVVVADVPAENLELAYTRAKRRAEEILALLQKNRLPTVVQQRELAFVSTTKKDNFIQGVEEIKAAIERGKVQQVVLSQRLVGGAGPSFCHLQILACSQSFSLSILASFPQAGSCRLLT